MELSSLHFERKNRELLCFYVIFKDFKDFIYI